MKSSQRGNVLFLILIAVALFAALSYAVTKSTSGGGNAQQENDALRAAEIVQYASNVKISIDRMRIVGSCSDTQISFLNSVAAGYTNGSAPADNSCHVFHGDGGGVSWQTPSSGINDGSDWLFLGGPQVHGVGKTDFDTASSELAMLLFNLNEGICNKINSGLGHSFSTPPVDGSNYGIVTKFTGSYTVGENINGIPGSSNPSPCPGGVCGIRSACFLEEGGLERYIYYHVLIER